MINLIQYIPLIGQPIYTFLKESFTLNNIKQNSIFIFDDFERITVIGLNEFQYEKNNYYINPPYYKKTPSLGRKIDSRDIEKEFDNIEKEMQKFKKIEEDRIYTETFQKYNVVTGLINELVDSYNLKVVIICNIDILGYKYLDLIFRGKLDCINYIKSVDINTFDSVFNDILNNQIFNKNEQKVIIGEFFNAISEDFKNVVELYGRTNLRYVKTTIQAFIETITLYFEDDIDSSFEYLLSLFYSIFVSKSLYDEGNITHLSDFETGGNLCFYLDLYSNNRDTKLLDALSSSKFSSQINWAGLPASSYWIMNMNPPRDLITQLVNYSSYPYCKEEYGLFVHPNFKNDTSYLIEHILYMLFRIRNNEQDRNAGSELGQNIINYLNTIDVNTILFGSEMLTSQDVVNTILDKMYRTKHVSSYQNVYRDIYDKLYEKNRIDAVPNNSQIHADYNIHVDRYYIAENE